MVDTTLIDMQRKTAAMIAWNPICKADADKSVILSSSADTLSVYYSDGGGLGKRFIGTTKHGRVDFVEDKWHTAKQFELGVRQFTVANPAALHSLMSKLVNEDRSQKYGITLGRMTEDAAAYIGVAGPSATIRRRKQDGARFGTFRDGLTHAFLIDIDKLKNTSGFDLVSEWGDVADWIVNELLPEEWRSAAVGVYPTAKCGLVGEAISARLVAWLQTPIMLDQMSWYVDTVVRPCLSDTTDCTIYSSQAYIFTAPPVICVDGVDRPDIYQQRYVVVNRDCGALDLDGLVFGTYERKARRARPDKSADQLRADGAEAVTLSAVMRDGTPDRLRSFVGRSLADVFANIREGNTQYPVLSISSRIAKATPRHREAETLLNLQQAFFDFFSRMPGDEVKRAERMREHVDGLPHKWRGAVEKYKYGFAQPSIGKDPPHRVTLEFGRQQVARHIADALLSAIKWQPQPHVLWPVAPHTLINATLGVGKTEALVRGLTLFDTRDYRIHILVPTDRLGQELLERLQMSIDPMRQGPYLRQHRGRAQPGMCVDRERNGPDADTHNRMAQDMEDLGFSPYNEVCKNCPHRNECPWFAQHDDKGSGIIIKTHAHMGSTYDRMRAESSNAPDIFVIDESPLSSVLVSLPDVPISDLQAKGAFAVYRQYTRKAKRKPGDSGGGDVALYGRTTDFIEHRSKWVRILSGSSDTVAMQDVRWLSDRTVDGIDEAAWALGLEHQLRENINKRILDLLQEGKSATIIRKIEEQKAQRRASLALTRLIMIAKASLDIPGREYLFGVRMIASRGDKMLSVTYSDGLPDVMKYKPTIVLDATADEYVQRSLNEDFAFSLNTRRIDVQPGAYSLTVIGDHAFSRSSMRHDDDDDAESSDERRARKDRRLAYVHRSIFGVAQEELYRGSGDYDVLVLCPKGVDDAIRSFGELPRVAFLTYGNTRGIDAYKDIPAIVAIGRSSPGVSTLEQHTEALHLRQKGTPTITRAMRWISGHHDIEMADGSWRRIPGEVHPDARVEAYRRQIVDAEVIQGLGRARVVSRTAANPVRLFLFGQTNVGLPATSMAAQSDMERSVLDIMTERGLILSSPAMMTKMYAPLMQAGGAGEREAERFWISAREKFKIGALMPVSGRMPEWEEVSIIPAYTSPIPALLDRTRCRSNDRIVREIFGTRSTIALPSETSRSDDHLPAWAQF